MREETRCHHTGYSFRLAARVLLYAPSHRQDITYHGLCYTSRGALAGTRNSSMGPPHEGSIRRPIAPRAKALTTELHLAPIACVSTVSKYASVHTTSRFVKPLRHQVLPSTPAGPDLGRGKLDSCLGTSTCLVTFYLFGILG